MQDEVVIQGKRYKLVPAEEQGSLISQYRLDNEESVEPVSASPREAVPKVSDYRERFKQKRIRINEITAKPRSWDVKKTDSMLDDYNYKGDSLFFGEGLEQEI